MMPKVAFVLTVYNKESWIAQTLRTIQDQTLKDIEIVIWNDGSTDHSVQIIQEFAKKDSRIKFYDNATNQGISKAYNQVHGKITAPYVCIASADDFYTEKRAQLTKDYFDKHPEKYIMYGNFWRIAVTGKVLEHKICQPYKKEDLFLPNNQFIPHGFCSVRKEVLLDNPYDETLKYGIDYPWFKQLANKYEDFRFGKIDADLGYYRWYEKNVSHVHRHEIVQQDNA